MLCEPCAWVQTCGSALCPRCAGCRGCASGLGCAAGGHGWGGESCNYTQLAALTWVYTRRCVLIVQETTSYNMFNGKGNVKWKLDGFCLRTDKFYQDRALGEKLFL